MRAFLAAALVCGVCASPALAATGSSPAPAPGIHIDPGSPAAKEYRIPITSTRQETAGSSSGSTGSVAPTFGVGVTPSRSPRKPSANHPRTTSAISGTSSRKRSGGPAETRAGRPRVRLSAADSGAVGSNSWLPLAVGGGLVLLFAGAGGFVLRRRS